MAGMGLDLWLSAFRWSRVGSGLSGLGRNFADCPAAIPSPARWQFGTAQSSGNACGDGGWRGVLPPFASPIQFGCVGSAGVGICDGYRRYRVQGRAAFNDRLVWLVRVEAARALFAFLGC